MKRFTSTLFALALLSVATGQIRADDKKEIDKTKLVGTWKITNAEGLPEGSKVEFTKDGKLSLTIPDVDTKIEGTWKIEGDKLLTEFKINDNEVKDTDTIKELTDTKLTLITKDGKDQEFERVKKK